MASDGRLHEIFRERIPDAHWQRIESGGLGRGTPDLNGCLDGVEAWVENKLTLGWVVASMRSRAPQVGWLERRRRAGGRCFIAVRQTGKRRDALWLLSSGAGRSLLDGARLDELPRDLVLGRFEGGPALWGWSLVRKVLFGR